MLELGPVEVLLERNLDRIGYLSSREGLPLLTAVMANGVLSSLLNFSAEKRLCDTAEAQPSIVESYLQIAGSLLVQLLIG
jgi:hypothetical protein